MIGTARGTMISTIELQEQLTEGSNPFVYVDHQLWGVFQVKLSTSGMATVTLLNDYYTDWDLQVAKEDWDEPLWEVEGQS